LEKYTNLNGRILAIFAEPEGTVISRDVDSPASMEEPASGSLSQAEALQRGVPTARVIRIPGASHFVFQSHEAQVIKEMNLFLDGLSR
jgi:pimeloyl-ACP methyl ester carboxylesterase